MILVDTSALLASYDRRDRNHAAVVQVLMRPQRRILSPFVLAELDYLISKFAGQQAELEVLEDVARGSYELQTFSGADIAAARALIQRYSDLRPGLADTSILVLAERYSCSDVLTFDERHFRAVSGPGGEPFRVLPGDEI